MSNWPTQPPEEDPEQEKARAERLRHEEAVTRWRTPPAEPTKDKDLPKVSTGGGSFMLPRPTLKEFLGDYE